MPTEIRNSQLPEEEKKEEKATLIKSNDPVGKNVFFRCSPYKANGRLAKL